MRRPWRGGGWRRATGRGWFSFNLYGSAGESISAPMRWNGGNQCWWTGTQWKEPGGVP